MRINPKAEYVAYWALLFFGSALKEMVKQVKNHADAFCFLGIGHIMMN